MAKEYPIQVVFAFRNEEERNYILGQLSDGFGENEMNLEWAKRVDLYKAKVVCVRPMGDNWEHHKRMRAKYGR